MLSLSAVGVTYQGKPIVTEASISISPGEIHALMGPNGSGKSTLSLALAGRPEYDLTPMSKIELDGKDLLSLLPHERAQVGLFLTFQSPVTIAGVSVKQMMKMMTDHLRTEPVAVSAFLKELQGYAELVGIKTELLDRSVNDGFSGGEKKRLEMLGLLLARPKYAILDEIDSGLDVDAIKLIAQAIGLAQREFGTGFLIVTHYRRILEYLQVDRVHVLVKGKLMISGDKTLINQIETDGYKGLT